MSEGVAAEFRRASGRGEGADLPRGSPNLPRHLLDLFLARGEEAFLVGSEEPKQVQEFATLSSAAFRASGNPLGMMSR